MDIKLTDGDISLKASGDYDFVSALDEALQRASICMKIRKGSFIYNKELGSEINTLDPDASLALKTADMLLSEALMDMPEYSVTVSSLELSDDGSIKALIEAESKEGKKTAEVIFNADL